MQILELETIPREPGKLTELIADAKRRANRHRLVLLACGLMVFVGMCMLMYTFVQNQPVASSLNSIYLPVVIR